MSQTAENSSPNASPQLEAFFVPSSLVGFLVRRHPYDFVETYVTLRRVYGYQAYYVNLGYWPEGAETVEPGRQLTLRVAEARLLPQACRPAERHHL